MPQPKVSVIIPTFNYAHYIGDAINSIFNQSYPKQLIEIIIVDDGSTDDTQQVLRPWIESGEVSYYYQQNEGKASATSKAIEKSNGKYIFNLDADDYFFNNKVERTVTVFETDPGIVHVASAARILHDDTRKLGDIEPLPGNIVGKALDGEQLLNYFYDNNILFGGGTTYAARASVLKNIEIPPVVDMYIDEFLILAILPFGKSYFVPSALSVWRVHSSNYSRKADSGEKKRLKNERLLKSSRAILDYLIEKKFKKEFVDIYRIKDATRGLAFKEFLNQKSLKDIWIFADLVFIQIQPRIKIIRKYQVINRLIPNTLFKLMKKLSTSIAEFRQTTQ
jgi:glycosyltransferase involved in cell wall biosynthesis